MSFGTVGDAEIVDGDMVLVVFCRLARGELGTEGGMCSAGCDELAGGVDAFVITPEIR